MSDEERDNLVLNNTGLIHLVIKQMHLKWNTEDEWQNYYDFGLEGLINASKKFDAGQDIKFSTFACVCIKNMIARCLYFKTLPKNFNEHGADISLNYLIGEGDNAVEYGDYIPDQKVNVEDEIEKKLEIERLLNAVDNLENEQDKLAIKMYYGLDGYSEGTLESIANVVGCTRERIRQRVARAKRNLKRLLEKNDRDVFVLKPTDDYLFKQFKNLTEEAKIIKREEGVCKKMEKENPKNTLLGLNDILFNQLNKLNSVSDDDFDKEIRKSYAVSQLAQQIVANTNTCIKALNLAKEQKIDSKQITFVGINEK
ncbi:MAG: sigma-70 family RNA polymerase sigma factor [Treponema sp.]|nr:sigma-70 family RNA polymerase sigma factor [Clostridia bacterium]MBP3607035.1 sigma-70 family RNA polymerase sigma factor [Treponema sp.]